MNKNDLAIIISTVPDRAVAESIARALIEEKLAACVNIIPGISSIYSWEGQIEKSEELLLLIKTKKQLYKNLELRLIELHPYDTPEIVMLETKEVAEKYLRWINLSCLG